MQFFHKTLTMNYLKTPCMLLGNIFHGKKYLNGKRNMNWEEL